MGHQQGINDLESQMTQFLEQMTVLMVNPMPLTMPRKMCIVVSIVKFHVWKLFKTTRLRSNPNVTYRSPVLVVNPMPLTTCIVVSIVKFHVYKLFKTTRLHSNPNVTRVVLLWTIMMLVLAIDIQILLSPCHLIVSLLLLDTKCSTTYIFTE